MAESSIPFKRKAGRPFVGATTVGVRLAPAELHDLDEWLDDNMPDARRPEAIRELMRRGMRRRLIGCL